MFVSDASADKTFSVLRTAPRGTALLWFRVMHLVEGLLEQRNEGLLGMRCSECSVAAFQP